MALDAAGEPAALDALAVANGEVAAVLDRKSVV
jgi:hypothetical protein